MQNNFPSAINVAQFVCYANRRWTAINHNLAKFVNFFRNENKRISYLSAPPVVVEQSYESETSPFIFVTKSNRLSFTFHSMCIRTNSYFPLFHCESPLDQVFMQNYVIRFFALFGYSSGWTMWESRTRYADAVRKINIWTHLQFGISENAWMEEPRKKCYRFCDLCIQTNICRRRENIESISINKQDLYI